MRRPHLTALLLLVPLAAAVNAGVGFLCALRADVTEIEPRVAASSEALHEIWHARRPRGYPDLPVDHAIKDHRAVGFRRIVGRNEHLDRMVFLLQSQLPFLSLDVPRFIPDRGNWPGFVVNTIFSAALLWACTECGE